jgi:hypothetical protein
LQQAYYSENNLAGGWTLIGYTAPGSTGQDESVTTNFKYGKGEIPMNNSTSIGSAAKTGWTAMNLKDLNDCKIANATANWTVKVSDNGSLVFDAAANGAGCVALTPTFGNIGK